MTLLEKFRHIKKKRIIICGKILHNLLVCNFKSKRFVICLTLAFTLLMPPATLAAEDGAHWQVENFGVFRTPSNWQTVKLEEVLNNIEQALKNNLNAKSNTHSLPEADITKLSTDFANFKNILSEAIQEKNINIYQVSLDVKNSYYTAGLLLYKNDKPLNLDELAYFGEKTSQKNRQEFAAIIEASQNYAAEFMQTWSKQNHSLGVELNLLPDGKVELLTVKKMPAYSIGTRVFSDLFGLTYPYYVKTYVLNLDGYMAYVILWCVDSERAFWDKTFKSVLSSIK